MSDYLSLFRLDDKVAIVTGGGKGIGKNICQVFAEAGAQVVIAEIDKDAGKAVAEQIREAGGKSLFLYTDVMVREQVTGMVEATMKEFNGIDILVNNIGGPKFNPQKTEKKGVPAENSSIITMTDEFWDWHIKFNLTSVFWCCHDVGQIMAAQNSGNIINISSVSGNRPAPGNTAYGTPKAAVIHLTKILALELAHYNVRVNCITPMLILHSDQEWGLSPDLNEQKKCARNAGIVVGRIGKVEDVSLAALYFASEASSFVTGEILDVAGGPLYPTEIMERFESQFSTE